MCLGPDRSKPPPGPPAIRRITSKAYLGAGVIRNRSANTVHVSDPVNPRPTVETKATKPAPGA